MSNPLSKQIVATRRFQRPGEPASFVVEYADGHTEVVAEPVAERETAMAEAE